MKESFQWFRDDNSCRTVFKWPNTSLFLSWEGLTKQKKWSAKCVAINGEYVDWHIAQGQSLLRWGHNLNFTSRKNCCDFSGKNSFSYFFKLDQWINEQFKTIHR